MILAAASENPYSGYIAVAVVFLFIFGIVALVIYRDKKRTDKIEAIAASLGFTFRRKATADDNALLAGSQLATHGHSRKICNIIEAARTDDLNITLLDYSYTVGSGKNAQTTQQTVMRMQSPMLNLPEFVVYPESIFSTIAKVFGYADINFPESLEFSKMYMLRGPEEAPIRQVFTPTVIQFCEQHRGISVESARDRLLFFRAGKRTKPEELEALITDGKQMMALLFDANQQSA
jgi:hypothetical protein